MISINFESLFTQTATEEAAKIDSLNVTMQDNLKWISMVDRLANGDLTKHDAIYEKNYIECLNLLSFWWYKDKYEDQVRRQSKLQNALR